MGGHRLACIHLKTFNMFELKLVDIFSTLCVGSVTALLAIYIYFMFSKLFVQNKYDNELFTKWIEGLLKTGVKDSWYAFLAVVLLYFFGIIAGDLTGRMTDSDDHKASILNLLKYTTRMESEGHLRKEALINIHTDSSLTGLGTSIFLNKLIIDEANHNAGTQFFSNHPGNKDSLIKTWNEIKVEIKKDDARFTGFVFMIYYTAKNWVYSKEHEPLNELKDIQHRIDLSRSIVLILAFALMIILAIAVVYTLSHAFTALGKLAAPPFRLLYKGFITGIVLLIICRECYHINEINYLKRAFGYYVSDMQQRKEKIAEQAIVIPVPSD